MSTAALLLGLCLALCSAISFGQCVQRKEYRDTTDEEWNLFREALLSLQNRPSSQNGGWSEWDDFANFHNAYSSQTHNKAMFFPWHRAFLFKLENRLRSLDPKYANVFVPYWSWSSDWANPISSPIFSSSSRYNLYVPYNSKKRNSRGGWGDWWSSFRPRTRNPPPPPAAPSPWWSVPTQNPPAAPSPWWNVPTQNPPPQVPPPQVPPPQVPPPQVPPPQIPPPQNPSPPAAPSPWWSPPTQNPPPQVPPPQEPPPQVPPPQNPPPQNPPPQNPPPQNPPPQNPPPQNPPSDCLVTCHIPRNHCLKRSYNPNNFPKYYSSEALASTIIRESSYTNFKNTIEQGSHGQVHVTLGGDTGDMSFMSSPNDPIFFLHHASIDRMWYLWQQLSESRSRDYPANLDQNIPGFDLTVRDMVDYERACVGYNDYSQDGVMTLRGIQARMSSGAEEHVVTSMSDVDPCLPPPLPDAWLRMNGLDPAEVRATENKMRIAVTRTKASEQCAISVAPAPNDEPANSDDKTPVDNTTRTSSSISFKSTTNSIPGWGVGLLVLGAAIVVLMAVLVVLAMRPRL